VVGTESHESSPCAYDIRPVDEAGGQERTAKRSNVLPVDRFELLEDNRLGDARAVGHTTGAAVSTSRIPPRSLSAARQAQLARLARGAMMGPVARREDMFPRRPVAGVSLVLLALIAVAGCSSPPPSPTPRATITPTGMPSPSPTPTPIAPILEPQPRLLGFRGEDQSEESALPRCDPARQLETSGRQETPAVAGDVELDIIGQLGLVPNQVVDGLRARILRLLASKPQSQEGPSCHMLTPASPREAGWFWCSASTMAGR